jgi:hypothetical protein
MLLCCCYFGKQAMVPRVLRRVPSRLLRLCRPSHTGITWIWHFLPHFPVRLAAMLSFSTYLRLPVFCAPPFGMPLSAHSTGLFALHHVHNNVNVFSFAVVFASVLAHCANAGSYQMLAMRRRFTRQHGLTYKNPRRHRSCLRVCYLLLTQM